MPLMMTIKDANYVKGAQIKNYEVQINAVVIQLPEIYCKH